MGAGRFTGGTFWSPFRWPCPLRCWLRPDSPSICSAIDSLWTRGSIRKTWAHFPLTLPPKGTTRHEEPCSCDNSCAESRRHREWNPRLWRDLPPADNSYSGTSIHKNDQEWVQVEVNSVGPGYFETVRIPLARGRDFRWTDDQDSRQIAIISQPVAERFWPDADPIGKRIYSESESWEVVGVAREIRGRQLGGAQNPHVYFSLLQRYQGTFTLMARSPQQPTSATVATMRRTVQELDNDLPTFGPTSLSAAIADSVAPWLFLNFLLGAFGVLALTLASVGLYGVLSRSVLRRTHEIAVRLALGAGRNHTVWLILRRTLVMVAIGLSIGLGLALGLGQLMGTFLPGFGPGAIR